MKRYSYRGSSTSCSRAGRAAHDAKAAAALMSERHGRQLLYYAEAVRRIFGRRPDRVCVFPLQLGEAVDIELPEK